MPFAKADALPARVFVKLKLAGVVAPVIVAVQKDKDASKFTREFGILIREVRQIAQRFTT